MAEERNDLRATLCPGALNLNGAPIVFWLHGLPGNDLGFPKGNIGCRDARRDKATVSCEKQNDRNNLPYIPPVFRCKAKFANHVPQTIDAFRSV
jgi:hypothetical protein